MPEIAPAPRLFIGSRVTYGGPHNVLHGRPLLVLPCRTQSRCLACDDWDYKHRDAQADREHFMIIDLATGTSVKHAARWEVTPVPHEWPKDAVPFNINGYWYAAAYTTAGGSDRARMVHFYTAEDLMGRTWCRFREPAPDIRRLDELGRRRPVI
ncbi:hypothetical protein [Streptomyces sp. NPDC057257]|uniref:hypothetical protein n=1 Tax=Streptomyces sp. NPDC057257 TaxID=3346071 RepID=UPI00362E1D84